MKLFYSLIALCFGLLHLHAQHTPDADEINDYFPDIENSCDITTHELLTHTSGSGGNSSYYNQAGLGAKYQLIETL